ncbi:unnamed protein product, partial [Didymodactylos carnosus]
MASSTAKKSPCVTCGKAAGLFTCRGCAKDFCMRHVSEHRQTLGKQMDEVTLDHDQLRHMITECTANSHCHPLLKQIDKWEQQSVDKIHQAAEDARQQLLTVVGKHMTYVTEALEQFKQQLSKARDDEEYFETDLEEWKKKLDRLKNDLTALSTISILEDDNLTPFVSKIIVTEARALVDFFERPTGDIQMKDSGQVIVHGQTSAHAAVRGRGEYSSGQHRFRFNIEQLGATKWVLFAVVSKNAPMQTNSYSTPSTYGWAGQDQVYINGVQSSYKSDMEMNDTLELLVDCDRQM